MDAVESAEAVRWFSRSEVLRHFGPQQALAAVKEALHWQREGLVEAPTRLRVSREGVTLLAMPATTPAGSGTKVLTVAPDNIALGLPAIQGVMLVFGPDHGELRAVIDGAALTAVRTAGIAACATQLLADEEASSLLLVGAGAQAAHQVEAILAVRHIQRLLIWNRTQERAELLAARVLKRCPRLCVEVVSDVTKAAASSDIITLVTGSRTPLLALSDLPRHVHINAMGAHEPDARELASDVIQAADVFVDTVEGCRAEAGDLLIPIAEGSPPARVRPLADVDLRHGPLTVMKSVGSSVFDLSCGIAVMNACEGVPMGRTI